MFDLDGKVVVVTGGGRGIGRGIVRQVAAAGAHVVIAGRTSTTLEETADEIGDAVRAVPVVTDVTDPDDLVRLRDTALSLTGRIDGWVNNAGSARTEDVGPLLDLREDQWDAVVDLNLKWTFFAAQCAAKAMWDTGGSIVNISSRAGSQPNPTTGHYGAAKAGVDNLTATMAVEWGHRAIRVNGIAPGVVPTSTSMEPGGTMAKASRRQRQVETVPLRRLGDVDEIGAACVFLIADDCSWMTGETIQITGGSRIPISYLSYMRRITRELDDANAE